MKTNCAIHGNSVEAVGDYICEECYRDMAYRKRIKDNPGLMLQFKQSSLIPRRFYNSTFDNYFPVTNKAQEFLEFCKDYDFRSNILMLGNTGTGKTHLACALADSAIRKNMSCMYVNFYELTDVKINKPNLFDDLQNCDFLIIDEYGQQDSDFKSSLLFEIINHRYNNERYTVLISNLGPDKFKSSISAPLYSRLKGNVAFKGCDWEDYRLKGAK